MKIKNFNELRNNLYFGSDHSIISDFTNLLFVDEPILFFGRNLKSNIVLGSLSYFDVETDEKYYLYTITDYQVFSQFLNCQISYLDLLKLINRTILNIFDRDEQVIFSTECTFNQIPEFLLPEVESYLTEPYSYATTKTVLSMQGGYSETHKITPKGLQGMLELLDKFGRAFTKALKPINLEPLLFVNAIAEGSLKLNLSYEVNQELELFCNSEDFMDILQTGMKEIFFGSADSNNKLIKFDNTKTYQKLTNLFNTSGVKWDASEFKELENYYLDSVDNIKKIFEDNKENFDRVVLYANNFEPVSEYTQNSLKKLTSYWEDKTEYEEYQKVWIQVYQFNNETGKGKCVLYTNPVSKTTGPSFRISLYYDPKNNSTENKITESLHFKSVVEVIGVLKKINGEYKNIDIVS